MPPRTLRCTLVYIASLTLRYTRVCIASRAQFVGGWSMSGPLHGGLSGALLPVSLLVSVARSTHLSIKRAERGSGRSAGARPETGTSSRFTVGQLSFLWSFLIIPARKKVPGRREDLYIPLGWVGGVIPALGPPFLPWFVGSPPALAHMSWSVHGRGAHWMVDGFTLLVWLLFPLRSVSSLSVRFQLRINRPSGQKHAP